MDLLYSSTRNSEKKITASQAILKGLADDGGLFVPESIPALDVSIEELSKMSYQQVAYEVMKLFLTDFTEEELKNCINRAYDSKFDTTEIAPLKFADGAYYLELFHGSTIAFKDMALSILPHLLITSAKKNNVKNEIVILTATSGDTGKAAMAGFADVEFGGLLCGGAQADRFAGRDSGGDFDRFVCDCSVSGLWFGIYFGDIDRAVAVRFDGSVLFGIGRVRCGAVAGKLCADAASGG